MSADFSRYHHLTASFPHEVVTVSHTQDVRLPSGAGTMALIRLDNGQQKRPNTLGPGSLISLGEAIASQAARAEAGEIVALGVTGSNGTFAAGADIVSARELTDSRQGIALAELGHDALNLLADFPAPTFAFINGTALGGGLEIALASDYRTVSESAPALGLPEAFLGLVPGWGGIYRLPQLIGPEAAAQVIFTNAMNNNRTLSGADAAQAGIADKALADTSFEQDSLTWAATIITHDDAAIEELTSHRAHDSSDAAWSRGVDTATQVIASTTQDTAPGPTRALEIFRQVPSNSREQDRELEVKALGELLVSDEFKNVVYGFMELVQKRAKKPAGVPEAHPRGVQRIGVVGAGLMASQLALLFAQRLQVPVVITDLDQQRVDKGLGYVSSQIDRLVEKGKVTDDTAQKLNSLVTGSTEVSAHADADFVIEAVFEDIEVKKKVFADLEQVVAPHTVLATNTSSLSVTEMAKGPQYPERVIGFHFFNPVHAMPLVEMVRTDSTADEPIATAFDLAAKLRKSPVLTKDSTGFVVNRVLLRMMSEVQRAFDEGTEVQTAENALKPLGLPMTPFQLLDMVGIEVAQHVVVSLQRSFGDRFYVSKNLQALIDHGITSIFSTTESGATAITEAALEVMDFGASPQTSDQLRSTVLDALAEEIGLLLDEGVVASPKDVDLCLLLGAGWPFHRGGITPYLDQQGVSQRVNRHPFHS